VGRRFAADQRLERVAYGEAVGERGIVDLEAEARWLSRTREEGEATNMPPPGPGRASISPPRFHGELLGAGDEGCEQTG
jgi:hypothetical protein